jgi:hypothetical protein
VTAASNCAFKCSHVTLEAIDSFAQRETRASGGEMKATGSMSILSVTESTDPTHLKPTSLLSSVIPCNFVTVDFGLSAAILQRIDDSHRQHQFVTAGIVSK